MSKLTKSEITAAVAKFARRKGYSASTVRTTTTLFLQALADYRANRDIEGYGTGVDCDGRRY